MERLFILKAALIAIAVTAWEGSATSNSGTTPIAHVTASNSADYDRVIVAIRQFADENGFAVQEVSSDGWGMLDFHVQLFRDDIKITVSRLEGEPIDVASFPLCHCVTNTQIGIDIAAKAAAEGLARALSPPER